MYSTAGEKTRSPLSLLMLTAAFLLVASCDSAVPDDPHPECGVVLEGRCWTYLGLDGQYITAVADTPWGVMAGGRLGHLGEVTGVHRLDRETRQWQAVGLDHAVVSDMLLVPADTARLLVAMRPASSADRTDAAVFATEDGETWLPWDGGLAMDHDRWFWARRLAMDPGDPQRLYWGQSNSILRSEDGGRSWEYVLDTPGGNGVDDIHVSSRRDGRLWETGRTATVGSSILRRGSDWGSSWEIIQLDLAYLEALHFDASTDRLWAGEHGRIRYSLDEGDTWHESLVVDAGIHGLFFEDDQIVAVASGVDSRLRLYRSDKLGTHWVPLGVPQPARGATAVARAADGGLVIGTTSGVWRVSNPFEGD